MGVTVHHLQASRSDRLFLLLEEMGAPYDVKVHFRNKAGQAEPTLAQAVPLGKVCLSWSSPASFLCAFPSAFLRTFPLGLPASATLFGLDRRVQVANTRPPPRLLTARP